MVARNQMSYREKFELDFLVQRQLSRKKKNNNQINLEQIE